MPVARLEDGLDTLTPVSGNGIAFSRSPGKVHNIAYLTPDRATKGGFFPNGTNGELTTSAQSR